MRLRRLVAETFRNLAPLDLDVDVPFVVFHGENAQGKTNLLESVHWLCTLKPLRGRRVTELVQWGAEGCAVAGWVEHRGSTAHHRVDLTREGRTARLDGKRVNDLEAYFAGVRAITFVPQDGHIVSGEPARRRNWIDRAAFTAAPAHLSRVRQVRQVLSQKAAALRREDTDRAVLDVLDEQLAAHGAALVDRRVRLLEELLPHVQALYGVISGERGSTTLQMRTAAKGETLALRTDALRARLAEVRPRELDRCTTLAGPQLDDVKVLLDGRPARTYGSRGQIRSLVLALKLAEMVAARARGEVPLFLIDDLSSELDQGRTTRLVGVLRELGAQVLLTTTDPAPLAAVLPRRETRLIAVRGGIAAVEPGPAGG